MRVSNSLRRYESLLQMDIHKNFRNILHTLQQISSKKPVFNKINELEQTATKKGERRYTLFYKQRFLSTQPQCCLTFP